MIPAGIALGSGCQLAVRSWAGSSTPPDRSTRQSLHDLVGGPQEWCTYLANPRSNLGHALNRSAYASGIRTRVADSFICHLQRVGIRGRDRSAYLGGSSEEGLY